MPRSRQARFDLRGGVTLAHSTEIMDNRELRQALNMRTVQFGSQAVRGPTQRMHATAIGSGNPVIGLRQWVPVGGRQLLAVAGSHLWKMNAADSAFTQVPAFLATNNRVNLQEHTEAGDPVMYIADGALWKYNGTTITPVIGAPELTDLAVYKTRMFGIAGKRVYWSRVLDPDDWALPNGGSAPIETYSTNDLVGLTTVGSSLLLFKANSIARFTGVSAADIRIDQETDGISADVGAIAGGTIIRMEEAAFFLSDRAPFIATEAGVQPIAVKVKPAFDDAEKDHWQKAVAVHNRAFNEVWVFFPENTQVQNTVGWCLNTRTQAWSGPWNFGGFNASTVAQFERSDGTETVVVGGYDGFVREADARGVPWRDDIRLDGTEGVQIPWGLVFPELLFGSPSAIKALHPTQWITANLGRAESMKVSFQVPGLPADSAVIESAGVGDRMYEIRPGTVGRRITMTIEGETEEDTVQVGGVSLEAHMPRRVGL